MRCMSDWLRPVQNAVEVKPPHAIVFRCTVSLVIEQELHMYSNRIWRPLRLEYRRDR